MSILKRIQSGGDNPPNQGSGKDASTPTNSMPARRIAVPTQPVVQSAYADLKNRVQAKLLSGLDPTMDVSKTADVR
ncbi:MAG: CpaF family protein, partial [Anaerolineaceae bacterium]|nr:CpaF family protein [Anaerolineaceae bacterium]